jgi:lipoyl-dependent peroxiredoxin
MQRTGSAHWEGDIKGGKGTVRFGSGAFEGPYSFATRFGDTPGTNPEEMIGAAHAACFSMALSGALTGAGHVPTSIDTKASVTIEKQGAGFAITKIELDCRAAVPGISPEDLERIAADAKANCPVSKALATVPITLLLTGPTL